MLYPFHVKVRFPLPVFPNFVLSATFDVVHNVRLIPYSSNVLFIFISLL